MKGSSSLSTISANVVSFAVSIERAMYGCITADSVNVLLGRRGFPFLVGLVMVERMVTGGEDSAVHILHLGWLGGHLYGQGEDGQVASL